MQNPALVCFASLMIVTAECPQDTVAPEIVDVTFPSSIVGDGSSHQGTLSFVDEDAGVYRGNLEPVSCPDGLSCPTYFFTFTDSVPDIVQLTEGTFTFSLECENPYAIDAEYVYDWVLFDVTGNRSEPFEFAYTCVGTSDSTSPVITDVMFPLEVPGSGSEVEGEVWWEDDNAGMRYAHFEYAVCPPGWTCTGFTYDFAEFAPQILDDFFGMFYFYKTCNNPGASDQYLECVWTLEDVEGHLSDPYRFGYTCNGVSRSENIGTVDLRRFLY